MVFRRRRKPKNSFLKRAFRSTFAVIILTAFVLGISLFVKELSTLNSNKLVQLSAPLLAQIGIDADDAGQVAGDFAKRVSQTGVVQDDSTQKIDSKQAVAATSSTNTSKELFKIAILSDSGDDIDNLLLALKEAKSLSVDYIIHLGDLTNWGDVSSLENVKSILNDSKITWYVLPGDHDLAQSVGTQNFLKVFDKNYTIIEPAGVKILLFDNSANYTPLDEKRFEWFLDNVDNADFVMLSQPIYHPTNERVMGKVDGEIQEDLYNQSKIMLSAVRRSSAKAIFAADQHVSSVNVDPEDSNLTHYVNGALSKSRNIQTPRFLVLTVFDDGAYDVSEIVL